MKEDESGERDCVAGTILDCLFEAAANFPNAIDLYNAQFERTGQYHKQFENIWNTPFDTGRTKTTQKQDCLVLAFNGHFYKTENHQNEMSAIRCFRR